MLLLWVFLLGKKGMMIDSFDFFQVFFDLLNDCKNKTTTRETNKNLQIYDPLSISYSFSCSATRLVTVCVCVIINCLFNMYFWLIYFEFVFDFFFKNPTGNDARPHWPTTLLKLDHQQCFQTIEKIDNFHKYSLWK